MQFSRKKSFLFDHMRKCAHTSNWKRSHNLSNVLLPNINFLISTQNKTPKVGPKMLKQSAGKAILRYVLPFTQAL